MHSPILKLRSELSGWPALSPDLALHVTVHGPTSAKMLGHVSSVVKRGKM